jgi:GGDEF domain-containing protein
VRGGDFAAHEVSRALRDLSSQERRAIATLRAGATLAHEEIAEARQLIAAARDQVVALNGRAIARDEALAEGLAEVETDPATGARTRVAGLADLTEEIDRANRTGGLLAVAHVGLAAAATAGLGDDAARWRAVRAIRGHLRSYDVVVRLADREVLCVMPGATVDDARHRFGAIRAALESDPEPCAITARCAGLEADDTATELIRRAASGPLTGPAADPGLE